MSNLADALNELIVAINTVAIVMNSKKQPSYGSFEHLMARKDAAIKAMEEAGVLITASYDERLSPDNLEAMRKIAVKANMPIGNMIDNGILKTMTDRREFERVCGPDIAIKLIDEVTMLRNCLDKDGLLVSEFYAVANHAHIENKKRRS